MKRHNDEYKGQKIEVRVADTDETLSINNGPIKCGQSPDGSYFLEKYAYDWKDNLEDLAKAFIDYQGDVKKVGLKKRLSKEKGIMTYRKNDLDLTTDETNHFAQALYHVKSTRLVDDFANLHATYFFHTIRRLSQVYRIAKVISATESYISQAYDRDSATEVGYATGMKHLGES